MYNNNNKNKRGYAATCPSLEGRKHACMHTTYYWGPRLYPHIRIPTTFFKPWQLEIFLVLDITQLSPLLVSKLLKRTRRCSNTSRIVGLGTHFPFDPRGHCCTTFIYRCQLESTIIIKWSCRNECM